MSVGKLIQRAAQAGLTLTVVDERLVVDGYVDDEPELMRALSANKDVVIAALQLEARLAVGWTRCEETTDPAERYRLDAFWIDLLHAYEATCNCPIALTMTASEAA